MVWAYEQYLRSRCKYNIADLRLQLRIALEAVPLSFVRKVMRKCFRYMSGYRLGAEWHGPMLDYAVKKFKQHRKIPADQITIVKNEFSAKQAFASLQRYNENA
jgi:hypothetical protein